MSMGLVDHDRTSLTGSHRAKWGLGRRLHCTMWVALSL
jgi:hypothetical protein